MKEEAKKKLLESRRMAAAQVAAIEDARRAGLLTRQEVGRRLHSYVLAKYMLDEREAASIEIASLAKQSLAKIMKIDKKLVGHADKSPTCDGASSVDMKQALLIVAIQKEFGIKLDGIEAAFADTTDDLADLVWEQMNRKA
jgi:acyl carrier protein